MPEQTHDPQANGCEAILEQVSRVLGDVAGDDADGYKVLLHVRDDRAETGNCLLKTYHGRPPTVEEIRRLAGGGVFSVTVQGPDGRFHGGRKTFELAGPRLPIHGDGNAGGPATGPAAASSSPPSPHPGGDLPGVLMWMHQSQQATIQEMQRQTTALLERLGTQAQGPQQPSLKELAEIIGNLQGRSATSEALEILNTMEDLADRRRKKEDGPAAGGGEIAELIKLGHAMLSHNGSGGQAPAPSPPSPPASLPAQEAPNMPPQDQSTVFHQGLSYAFSRGWTPEDTIDYALDNLPPVVLRQAHSQGKAAVWAVLKQHGGVWATPRGRGWFDALWGLLEAEMVDDSEDADSWWRPEGGPSAAEPPPPLGETQPFPAPGKPAGGGDPGAGSSAPGAGPAPADPPPAEEKTSQPAQDAEPARPSHE